MSMKMYQGQTKGQTAGKSFQDKYNETNELTKLSSA